jgi:uncharacterized protein YjiS (DUF1127 family)
MNNKSIAAGKSMRIYWHKYKWNIWQYALAWLSRVKKWRRNAKTRKQLANLDPSLYQDIGLTVTQIHHEIQKKFWQ